MGHGLGSFQHTLQFRLWRTVLEEGAWEPGMLKGNVCVLSCLPQGTRVWKEREDVWRLHWPKLRIKDKRLFL